jgi:hypothetical protein
MPGFTSFDDMIAEATVNGKVDRFSFYKIAPANAQAAGVWQSLWKATGTPGAGSDPAGTPGTVHDSDQTTQVAGAMWFPDRSTDLKIATILSCVANQNCSLMVYDRLAGVSGISLATTGNKTVNSGALTRYSGTAAVENEVWLEVTTATTVTAPVVSLNSYTSADGTTAQSGGTVTFPAVATVLHSMIQMPLSATKRGVRSVEVGLNVGTAATAGAVNLVILRELATIPLVANQQNMINLITDFPEMEQVLDNATLGLAILASGVVTTTVWGKLECIYG